MGFVSSYRGYPFALLVLPFLSSDSFHGIHCSRNWQQISANTVAVINHEHCQSCPTRVSSLKEVLAYSELKCDPQSSLPSSFTICVSVLATTQNLRPVLFTLLGNLKSRFSNIPPKLNVNTEITKNKTDTLFVLGILKK